MPELIVNEIFFSLQGESSRAGLPCAFVRLTGCNLRCSYCDSTYAFSEGNRLSVGEILSAVRKYRSRLVEVTGGEPLIQEGVYDLLTRLCDAGYETLLETGGSLDIGKVDPRVGRIVDFKCPGSGMVNKNFWGNVRHLKDGDEVKFVIGSREDFDWSVARVREHDIDRKVPVLMSVVFGELGPAQLAGWILESGINARMQLQLHKYIWDPARRGV
jgi:7-carboxy-7-deazaguanine synthase